jgi:alkanesulfonate monooxygenase SsuD/methylene tetrahydromethanopterin reductase-like flavin-dependent oxidoreductase (luciferase family)
MFPRCFGVTARPRVGTLFAPRRAIGELAEFAHQVETLGFDELWLAEDSGMYGAITAAATALGTTQRPTRWSPQWNCQRSNSSIRTA